MNGSWVGATARQIARAVQRGDATATGVTADHLDHAHLADRVLGAVRTLRDGVAIAEAELVDDQPDLSHLPLAGVPVLVQENTPVAGLPMWHGSATSRGFARADDEVVRRLRGAGAIVLGVSRMSELGLWATTDDDSAVTRNPWRGDRSPGGSAGGAAAAVAAGLVPLAYATDEFGSVRIPAACCGLVGFKAGTDAPGQTEHAILATTTADAALGYATISGRPATPLPHPGRLRLAVSVRSPIPGIRPDHAVRATVAAAARQLVGAGHDAISADPGYPLRSTWLGLTGWLAGAARATMLADAAALMTAVAGPDCEGALSAGRLGRGNDAGARLQARTRGLAALGERVARGPVRDGERADFRRRWVDWFARGGFDVLITPTLAGPPPPAAHWSRRSWPANVATGLRYAPYPAVWNLAGLPAVTVPVGVRPDGLPGSVQLVGPPGSELTLLAVAAQLEVLARPRHAPGWPRDRTAPTPRPAVPNRSPTPIELGPTPIELGPTPVELGPVPVAGEPPPRVGRNRARPAGPRRAGNRGGSGTAARPGDRATIWT